MIEFADVSLLLVAAVFIAALLQTVTGIGFGVIAGPILLVTIGNLSAIQVSIILSFLIAIILTPSTLPKVNWSLLKPLFIGICLGSLFGAGLALLLSIKSLKILAAFAVGLMVIVSTGYFNEHRLFEQDSRWRRLSVGTIAGILNTTLAMPGPAIATYISAINENQAIIRATTLVTFLLAYPLALVAQLVSVGLQAQTLSIATALLLPTVIGTVLGQMLAKRLSEKLFKGLVTFFLGLSVATLLKSIFT